MKINTLFKYLILYTFFIIGISILSEWLSYEIPVYKKDFYKTLDNTLECIKQEVRDLYLSKLSEKEEFSNFTPLLKGKEYTLSLPEKQDSKTQIYTSDLPHMFTYMKEDVKHTDIHNELPHKDKILLDHSKEYVMPEKKEEKKLESTVEILKNSNTFLEEKYSPENYSVVGMDPFFSSFAPI